MKECIMKGNYLLIWPRSQGVKHINYHFSQFGEYINYLEKELSKKVFYRDGDIKGEYGYDDVTRLLSFIREENIKKIVMHIDYENAGNSKDLIELIKKVFPDVLIMGYGNIPRLYPSLFNDLPIDALASVGHDQRCILSFFKDYQVNGDVSNLKGLKVKSKDGNVFFDTSDGEFIEASSWTYTPIELSKAYYDEINHARYVLNVSTGCPFNCEHCLLQLNEGRVERRRTIESIDEALNVIEKYFPYVEFFAANLTLDQNYVLQLCEMIKRKHPNITWGCATRIDEVTRIKTKNLVMDDSELLKVMSDAGCSLIGLGVESVTGNYNTIHTKDFVFDRTDKAIRNIQEANITAKAMIMLRIPNQTRQDVINTLYYLSTMNTFIRPTLYTPYHKIDVNNISLYDLYKYNRKKRPDSEESPVLGVSNVQFDMLLINPNDYIDILNVTKDELDFASNVVNDGSNVRKLKIG